MKFRFLSDIKYLRIFSQESETRQCTSFCFLQNVRRNHFQPRSKKMIFKQVNGSNKEQFSFTSIIGSLQNCRSVEEQIEVFHSVVKLTDDGINSRHSICQDLEKALQPYFLSPVSVCLVGSSINGLGFKGCDVDLSLQFSAKRANEYPVEKQSISMDETQNAEVPVNKVYAAKNQLLTIRKILQELKFAESLTIIPGRCPILNFSLRNLPCDLSLNNSLAIHSTNLMLLCGKLDERITPLTQVIIYWAKKSKLVGGPGKFKTYAIFLMVLYFLQTRNPPVLPSVETMFDKTEFLKNLENWSYDVTKYLSHFEKSQNNQTVGELLKEFFIFYGNFDFSHIICPINSSSIDRKLFSTKIDCSDNFVLNTICIQDPLNLVWNVTTEVNWKKCKNFLKAIMFVWGKYQDQSCWIPQTQKWGISCIIENQFTENNFTNVKEFTIDLPFTSAVVNFQNKNVSAIFEKAAINVKYILNYCLDFECYPASFDTDFGSLNFPKSVRTVIEHQLLNTSISSPEKNPAFSKDNTYPQLLAQYVCVAKDTWSGRNIYHSLTELAENVFDYEHKISKKLKLERGNNNKETFYFLCECYGSYSEGKECLQIKFSLLNKDKFIPKLVFFLKEYIPKLMEAMPYE